MSADIIQHPKFGATVTAMPPSVAKPPRRSRAQKVQRLPCDRVRLVLEASWELDVLTSVLLGEHSVDREEERFLHRAFVIGVRDLASVVMSVVGGDDGRKTADMGRVPSSWPTATL